MLQNANRLCNTVVYIQRVFIYSLKIWLIMLMIYINDLHSQLTMELAFYCLVQKCREGNKHKLKNSVQNTKSYFSQQ